MIPDKINEEETQVVKRLGVFSAKALIFILVEMGDKTQIATVAMAAYFQSASLVFEISHMSLSTFVSRFNDVDATLDFDPANIAATKLDAHAAVACIDVSNPDLEARKSH